MERKTNFAVVCKTGGDFGIQQIVRMYEQLKYAYRKDFKYYVLTDLPMGTDIPGIHIPLTMDLSGWFSKLELFKHEMGRVCFHDLDVTINAPLHWVDDLPTENGEFWAQECEHDGDPKGNLGSSCMIWQGTRSHIPKAFDKAVHYEMYHRRNKPPYYGDQNFIQHQLKEYHLLPRYFFAAWPFNEGHRWDHAKVRFYCWQKRPWDMGLPHSAINQFQYQDSYQRS